MNVSRRLIQIEKKMSLSYADSRLEEDLLKWLDVNPYEIGANFPEWCNKMPEYLVKPFANLVKRHVSLYRHHFFGHKFALNLSKIGLYQPTQFSLWQ